jgi:hypothetical protein
MTERVESPVVIPSENIGDREIFPSAPNFFPSGTTTPVEDFTSCIANNQRLSELTIGVWRNVYNGDYGRVTFGAQYEYIKRKAFNGIRWGSFDRR